MILTEDKTYSMSLMLEDGSSVNGLNKKSYELEFTNRELIHAVVTCAMPIQRLTPAYPKKREIEFMSRFAMVETALESQGDRLKKSHDLDFLDSGEKSMISYQIGMIFTKLISQKMFQQDYLTHINLIPDPEKGGYLDMCGMRRSDLIGFQRKNNAYSVFGAKGRSENSPRALENGCALAQSVKSVCGQLPKNVAVCMTYYESGYLTAYVKMPRSRGESELNFEQEEYFRAYYRPILEFFKEMPAHTTLADGRNREVTMYLPYFTKGMPEDLCRAVVIGISGDVYEKLLMGDYSRVRGEEPDIKESRSDFYFGKDYIYIR